MGGNICFVLRKGWLEWEVCDIVVVIFRLEDNVILSERVDGVEILISFLDWRFDVLLDIVFFFKYIWFLLEGKLFNCVLLCFCKIFFFVVWNWVVFFVVKCVVCNVFWKFEDILDLFEVIFFSVEDSRVLESNGELFVEGFLGFFVWGIELCEVWIWNDLFFVFIVFWNERR